MKTNYFLLAIFFSFYTYAQVGINTTLPKAQLEIKSSNQASPSNTDGIIIPKINAFPLTNPTAAQQSMMVYLTTTSAGKLPGFYYWDNTTVNWISVAGSKGWDLNGNSGTTSGNFIGTTDAQNLVFRTNNIDHLRITQKGQIEPLNTGNSVFIGDGAGANDDLSIKRNVFIGLQSGALNTVGYENTALGSYSLYGNTTGSHNTAIGLNALSSSNSLANTAVGEGTLGATTTGTYNTAIGYYANSRNISGSYNTAVGEEAMFYNIGSYNTVLGARSLNNSAAASSFNVSLGYLSCYSCTTGGWNTTVGSSAGYNITTGRYNLAIGYNTTLPSATNDNQMSIANVIYGSTMSTTALGKIGIGEPNPTEKLDVAGNLKVSGAIMPNNLAGATGQILTSAGAGIAPTWSSSSIQKYITTGVLTGIYSVPLTEYTVRVFNTVSGIQLPTAVGNQGKIFVIIGSNGIASKTLSTLGGVIYDDVTNTSLVTITTNQRFTVQSDGTNWIVTGR